MKVCVYGASSSKIDNLYYDAAEMLAKEFVRNKVSH